MTRPTVALFAAAALLAAVSVSWANPAVGLPWPAKYANATGTPCCAGNNGSGHWDCTRIPAALGAALTIGSTATVAFSTGPLEIRVNAVYVSETPDYVLCAPGCLFKPYMGSWRDEPVVLRARPS